MIHNLIELLDTLILQFHTHSDLLDYFLAILQVWIAIGTIEAALFAFWLDRQRKFLEDYKIRDEAEVITPREESLQF